MCCSTPRNVFAPISAAKTRHIRFLAVLHVDSPDVKESVGSSSCLFVSICDCSEARVSGDLVGLVDRWLPKGLKVQLPSAGCGVPSIVISLFLDAAIQSNGSNVLNARILASTSVESRVLQYQSSQRHPGILSFSSIVQLKCAPLRIACICGMQAEFMIHGLRCRQAPG